MDKVIQYQRTYAALVAAVLLKLFKNLDQEPISTAARRQVRTKLNVTEIEDFIDKKPRLGDTIFSNECSICTENLEQNNKKALSCHPAHVFHEKCINKWLLTKNCCPLCRKQLK